MRVLVLPPAMSVTHFLKMVPLCWALRAAGHEVLVAGTADLEAATRAAGLGFAETGSVKRFVSAARTLSEDTFPAVEWTERETTERGRLCWEMLADLQVTYTVDHIAAYRRFAGIWQPDLLLADHTAIIARVLGGVLGVPTVTHRWGTDPTGELYHGRARRRLGPLCTELGLPGLPAPDVIVDPCPPSLQYESAVPGLPIRYIPFNGTGRIPDWALTRPEGRRVCLCPGSTLLSLCGPGSVRRVVEALAALPEVETVVALTTQDRERLGHLPKGFRVGENLPVDLFMDSCDAVVSFGGGGVGFTAACFGLPQVTLPQWFDQFDYGRRLEDAAAGISLDTRERQNDIEGIRQAIVSVLESPKYQAGANRLRHEIESAQPPSVIVGELERLVSASATAA